MKTNLSKAAKLLIPTISLLCMAFFPASAQTQTRVIEWQPHPFGLITRVGEGMKLSSVIEALEITGFNVEGKGVTLGEPFLAGDEWLKTLKVGVRNISGQTLSWSQMNLYLPGSQENGRGGIMVRLQYGSVPSENPKPIEPGEEYELSMREWEFEKVSAKVKESQNPSILNRLYITVVSAHFADGTSWASGCIKATDRRNSCPLSAT